MIVTLLKTELAFGIHSVTFSFRSEVKSLFPV